MKLYTKNQFLLTGMGVILSLMLTGPTMSQTFRTLHNFTGSDGASPFYDNLILVSNSLYGTATYGGSVGLGTIFAINTDGSGFTNLHSFTAIRSSTNDGASPYAGLVSSSNALYGTTSHGGSMNQGIVFKIN